MILCGGLNKKAETDNASPVVVGKNRVAVIRHME